MSGNTYWNMLGVSNATPDVLQTTKLLCMQDQQGACSHGNNSRETLQCKHRGSRQVCITNHLGVDDTFTSRSANCVADVAAAAAVADAAKMILLCIGMNAK